MLQFLSLLITIIIIITMAWWTHVSQKVIPSPSITCSSALKQEMQLAIKNALQYYSSTLKLLKLIKLSKQEEDLQENSEEEFPALEKYWIEQQEAKRSFKENSEKTKKGMVAQELLAKNECFWNCAPKSLHYLREFQNQLKENKELYQQISESYKALEAMFFNLKTFDQRIISLGKIQEIDKRTQKAREQLKQYSEKVSEVQVEDIKLYSEYLSYLSAGYSREILEDSKKWHSEMLKKNIEMQEAFLATASKVQERCENSSGKDRDAPTYADITAVLKIQKSLNNMAKVWLKQLQQIQQTFNKSLTSK